MQKYKSLLSKIDSFERFASFNNRRAFLQSLAQNPSDISQGNQEVMQAIKSLYDSIISWIGTYGFFPTEMNNSANYIAQAFKSGRYDIDTLPTILNASKTLADLRNLNDLSSETMPVAWAQDIFPKAIAVSGYVKKQLDNLNRWKQNNPDFSKDL